VAGSVDVATVHDATLDELDALTLYRILALRSDVFVVEQECVYLDLDGLDLVRGARQAWADEGGVVVSTLRIVPIDGVQWIGRVATAVTHRGAGVAGQLMRHALDLCGDDPVALNAQSYLRDWYARFGFGQTGPEFLEDGIPHTPMRRRVP
jgi:ElaA protein